MCGIAGIVGLLTDANRAALARMSAAQAHRGPDGTGTWESTPDEGGWGVMFAQRRLAILDLSALGSQPMIDPHGDVLTYNGEIYNYVELRERLAAHGETVQSSGDTAPMLRTLARHGPAGVAVLRGMFAFAHWDPRLRRLLFARDPLGIKPLYLLRNPDPRGTWSLAFASEVRSLLASGLLATPRLDPQAVASVVWNGFVAGPNTAVHGIETLWPGEYLLCDARGRELERQLYWRMPADEHHRTAATEDELAETLRDTVRLHLASDVPLGVFLSGGIDSSCVAHLARQTSATPVHTFTLAFEEEAFNEGLFSRRIAQAIGTEHRELVLTERQFVEDLDHALDSLDQPSFDGLNTYYMARAVRDAGIKVALVGSGGDELFGGYTSFRDLPPLMRWARRLSWLPGGVKLGAARAVSRLLARRGAGFAPQTRWSKLPDMIAAGDDLASLYQLAYALFLPATQRELLSPAVQAALGPARQGLPPAQLARLQDELRRDDPRTAVSGLEQRLFLGERLLRDSDAASMASSIEMRLPLVDQALLEAVNRVPPAQRYEPVRSKALLRRIGLRGLDPALFDRPKSGFVLPYDRWLRQRLGERIDAMLEDPMLVAAAGLHPPTVSRLWRAFREGAPGLYWSRVWALFAHVRWCHKHGVSV
jgi:asparagine synthase (glutamine-hydrolysing)